LGNDAVVMITGACTVKAVFPFTADIVAVMVVTPAESPAARPLPLTVATAVLDEVQVA
jgi:hypothetical protein